MRRNRAFMAVLTVVLVTSVLAWSGVRREREFRRLVAAGDAALASDQTPLAIEAYSGAIAIKSDAMLGYVKRGDTYRRRGEFPAALRDLRRAAALDPGALRARELLGDVNAAMGRFQNAADDYAAFIAIDDRSPRVLYKLALARYQHGQAARAIEPLRQALAIDDRLAEAHHLMGICLRELRREADALRSLRQAVTLSPAMAAARLELAGMYTSLGRWRDAIQQLEALAALEPTRAEWLVAVAREYARAGRPATAVVTLGRAADQYPNEPVVHVELGRVWLEDAEARGDRVALHKALEALQPVASNDRASGEALALYGRALFLAGDSSSAERMLTTAAGRLPVDPDALLFLAAAAQRVGRPEAAENALGRYAILTHATAADCRKRLSDVLSLQARLRRPPGAAAPAIRSRQPG